MAKGQFINDDVRLLIAQVYLEDPEQQAKEVQVTVNARLMLTNPKTKPGWPGLSAIQKELTKIRQRDWERPNKSVGLDDIWSIGTLPKYDIPSDALPKVLQIQELRRSTKKPLAIREALWIGRLHRVKENIQELSFLSLYYYFSIKLRK